MTSLPIAAALRACLGASLIAAASLAVGIASAADLETLAARLAAAYPDHIAGREGGNLVWRDGTRMPLDDGNGEKSADEAIASADIEDMFRWPYPAGKPASSPPALADPGRPRNEAFFRKMYGDCRKGEVVGKLVDVDWLPAKGGGKVKVTRVNGVAERLAAVGRELDALPKRFDVYLVPSAGTYVCRNIAGTRSPSAHGLGIAVDIALAHAHYWRWVKAGPSGERPWRNAIPQEIVAVFEKHGFIWGGRWHHFDTMHFEYRPELIAPR